MTLKKMFLFVLAIAILIPAVSNATVSRYMGLGGPGTDFIAYDASNPTIYPSLTHKWQKLYGIEYGSTTTGAFDHTAVYCVWDFGGKSAIKFILDDTPSSTFDVNSTGVFDSPANFGGNFHMLNMQYGRPLGDNLDFGLGLRYEGKSYAQDEIPNVQPKVESSYSAFGLTLGITTLEKKLDAALAVDFGGFTRDEGPTTTIENDGSMQFSLQARYWHKYSETNTLVPHFRFVNHKLGATYSSAGSTTSVTGSETTTDLMLGLGHNWRPVEFCLIVFEVGFQAVSDEFDNGTSTETDGRGDIYWRAGGETRINSWLWGRAGAVRQWRGMTDETVVGTETFETSYGYSTTSIYAGGTVHWKRLHVDFLVEPDFFKYGPAFIGGDNPAGSGLTSRVSLKYELDEAHWLN